MPAPASENSAAAAALADRRRQSCASRTLRGLPRPPPDGHKPAPSPDFSRSATASGRGPRYRPRPASWLCSAVVDLARPPFFGPLAKLRRRCLHNRRRRVEDLAPICKGRRIDALAVDDLLGPLGGRARRDDVPIPSFGVHGAPRAEIETCHIPIDT